MSEPLIGPGSCARCRGQYWVCTAHPERGWPYASGEGSCCDAEGQPCPDCNTPPRGKLPIGPDGRRIAITAETMRCAVEGHTAHMRAQRAPRLTPPV